MGLSYNRWAMELVTVSEFRFYEVGLVQGVARGGRSVPCTMPPLPSTVSAAHATFLCHMHIGCTGHLSYCCTCLSHASLISLSS